MFRFKSSYIALKKRIENRTEFQTQIHHISLVPNPDTYYFDRARCCRSRSCV